jgi:hypothetical protein
VDEVHHRQGGPRERARRCSHHPLDRLVPADDAAAQVEAEGGHLGGGERLAQVLVPVRGLLEGEAEAALASELDPVALVQPPRAAESGSVEIGAVGGPEVGELELALGGPDDAGVLAGDALLHQADLSVGAPADDDSSPLILKLRPTAPGWRPR